MKLIILMLTASITLLKMEIEESRGKYAELYDFAPVGYLTFNEKGLIAAANLTSASMLGIERRELIHKPFSLFVRPDYRNLLHAHYRRVFESNTKQTCELGLVKKDGGQFHALMESIVVMDTDGNPTNECRSIITDITDQKELANELVRTKERLVKFVSTVAAQLATVLKHKQVEETIKNLNKTLEQRVAQRTHELQKANDELRMKIAEQKMAEKVLRMSENRYRMLLESLPQSIFYKNEDLVYVSCNENYTRYLNIRADEIHGKTAFDLFPETLAKKFEEEDKMILESGKVLEKEEKFVKDGKEVILHTVKTPVRSENGTIVGILGVFFDVTEKEHLRMEAIRIRQLASLGELAAGVAHEINNPINSVINYAQILSNMSHEGSKEKDIAGRIIKEGGRIVNIVGSLLAFARPGDKKMEKNVISLKRIVDETLTLTGAQLRKDGIRVKLDISNDLPEIYANEQMIQQVFLNIISNARYALNQKYPKKHDGKIIEILGGETTVSDSRQVEIIFCDHGTGVPAYVLGRMGESFFSTKPKSKGTGLGLSISRGIISEHGGKLIIDSAEGEFCKVTILMPVATNPDCDFKRK